MILFVLALISGGSKDSAAAWAEKRASELEVHYRREHKQRASASTREELSQPANEMLDLFVFPLDTPQMSHPAKRRLPISRAN